ncbi:unnamed protein product [Rhizoctonia solani]|uniref:DUF6535 domain-containing protein n=1 Tax=Rhizoctonia solani TaxID=456999 RepID=A0A8H2WD01_9AGAM|nr:unnamed protein product [Rhizoctonia solani]
MSLILPTNLSNTRKGSKKPDKNDIMFACDYPALAQRDEILETGLLHTGNQLYAQDDTAKTDSPPRKRAPVTVALVDADPVQIMDPDEYGAELGKEARVWKVYVQETDKWDRELVDGWNKSLDVILVFAALFSAVSTS